MAFFGGSTVKTYDPAQVQLIVGGAIIGGFAGGSMVEVSRSSDTWTKYAGATGEIARAKSNDRSGEVKITLMQTSLSNDVLSSMMAADELNNSGIRPFTLRDSNGNTILAAAQCWVKKPPTIGFGNEVKEREWLIDTGALDMIIGGNQ